MIFGRRAARRREALQAARDRGYVDGLEAFPHPEESGDGGSGNPTAETVLAYRESYKRGRETRDSIVEEARASSRPKPRRLNPLRPERRG